MISRHRRACAAASPRPTVRPSGRSGAVPAQRVDAVAQVLADAELGQPDEGQAQKMLEAIAPSYPAAWVSLSRLLYDYPGLGDTETMLGYLDNGRAAALPRAELLLGRLYYEGKLVPQDPHKAERHLRKAAPSEPSANYFLGQIYLRLEDPDKALAWFRRALEVNPNMLGVEMTIKQLEERQKAPPAPGRST